MPVNEPWIDGLVQALDEDAFASLNSSYRPAYARHEMPVTGTREVWEAIDGQPGAERLVSQPVRGRTFTSLPPAYHRNNSLRWLNLCHTDLDCYRPGLGLTVGDALGAIVNMQDAKRIPPATGFVRSGRGLWCFWLLVDPGNPEEGERLLCGVRHRPETPQRATAHALSLYARIQAAIAKRLAHLGADLGAIDAARYAPVHGTLRTGPNKRVEWWLQGGGPEGGIVYTLAELADALDVPVLEAHPIITAPFPRRPVTDLARKAAGEKGWYVRWRDDLRDVEMLLQLRGGGFGEGIRNSGAFIYALVLLRFAAAAHGQGVPIPDVQARLADYGAHCHPRLTPRELTAALAQARKARRGGLPLSRARIYHELQITEAEASYLLHIKSAPAVKTPAAIPPYEARRQEILAIVEMLGGYVPPTRTMARLLNERGIDGSHVTVANDYKVLYPDTAKHKAGRPVQLLMS